MYRLAREGKIKNFTGVDDPHEPPLKPETVLDTVRHTAEENAERILAYLVEQGFVSPTPVRCEGEEDVRISLEEAEGDGPVREQGVKAE